MFKHTVTYNDFNDNPRVEDLYFHLATHELTRLEASIGMGLEQYIKELTNNNKLDELLAFLEKVMITSFGIKSVDGKSFRKTAEIREEFEYSQAYAELFEQIVNNPELAKKFGEGVADKGSNKKKNQPMPTPRVVQEAQPTQE